MKKLTKILWGIVLVAAGVLFALNALEITNYDIFFDGWWTLFIIIPSLVGVITDRDKTGSLLGLGIGVLLLLWQQEIIELDLLWKLFLPILVIAFGLRLIFGGVFKRDNKKTINEIRKNRKNVKSNVTAFSGSDINYNGEVYEGGEYVATFGGIEVDLRGAIIEKDCVIEAVAVFGGVDIYVPDGINVEINSTSVFGGIDNNVKRNIIPGAPTVYVEAVAVFGGVDVI